MIDIELGNKLIINSAARVWCKRPYRNHPKGCPNYGVKLTCPPEAPLLKEYFDTTKPIILIALKFDLGEHARKLKDKYPHWSERQARCLLYWQPKQRKILRQQLKRVQSIIGDKGIFTTCPEAMGVNVIGTAQGLGVPIDVFPKDTIYLIGFAGCKGE